MPLVYACVSPHGGELIARLAKSKSDANLFRKTRSGIIQIAREVEKAHPDTIVIASPHNLRLWKKIGIIFSENSAGSLESESRSKVRVSLSTKCDVKLAKQIYVDALDRRLPVVGANYGTSEGPASIMPMDWGTFIPLWFLMPKNSKCKVVIVTPSREISLAKNFAFGRLVGERCAKDKDRRVVFVASADQAHSHKKGGLYGFHASAKLFDSLVLRSIEKNELETLLKLDPRFIEDAKPDSPWQLAMLSGCLSQIKTKSRLISYEVPTYYGMICADFTPT